MPRLASLASPLPRELLTAAEVARVCHVDLKTIHNWADRGRIRHFRTPGRHLRVRRCDLLEFLRRYGYPVPADLESEQPRIGLLWPAGNEATELATALAQRFSVVHHSDALAACTCMGAQPPELLIMPARIQGIEAKEICASLRTCPSTREVQVWVCHQRPTHASKLLDTVESMLAHARRANA